MSNSKKYCAGMENPFAEKKYAQNLENPFTKKPTAPVKPAKESEFAATPKTLEEYVIEKLKAMNDLSKEEIIAALKDLDSK